MKQFYYYRALRKQIIQFLDLFNDLQVARYNKETGQIVKIVKVPLKFAPKQKIFYWLNERKDDELLPIISAQINSMDFSPERMTNKHHKITTSTDTSGGSIARYVNPIPYNILFQLNIWSLHMVDIDMLLEQILPYFAPYVMMRIHIPEMDTYFEVKVLFQSAAPDIVFEMPDDERRIIKWNLDFMAHGFLFQPVGETGLVEEVITKIYDDEDRLHTYLGTETEYTSGGGHEAESLWMKALGKDETGEILYKYEVFD